MSERTSDCPDIGEGAASSACSVLSDWGAEACSVLFDPADAAASAACRAEEMPAAA
nr:MAG TPA: hypothetical protein [Caudoviricetes sp.]